MKKIIFTILSLTIMSCSSINRTFVYPEMRSNLIFAGTKNNVQWVSNPPMGQFHPYATMGIIDFIPSAALDLILLPYTVYEKYQSPSLP